VRAADPNEGRTDANRPARRFVGTPVGEGKQFVVAKRATNRLIIRQPIIYFLLIFRR
jgi:hypothetical protein